jgi:hypothetical protein
MRCMNGVAKLVRRYAALSVESRARIDAVLKLKKGKLCQSRLQLTQAKSC